jgi:hypothetical protein
MPAVNTRPNRSQRRTKIFAEKYGGRIAMKEQSSMDSMDEELERYVKREAIFWTVVMVLGSLTVALGVVAWITLVAK